MFYDAYEKLCIERGKKPFSLPVELGIAKTNSIVAQWKAGSTPRSHTLQTLASYFNVPVSYFLDSEEKEPPRPKAEAVGPNKRALLSEIADMTEGEMALLLEKVRKIKESRG